MVVESGVLRNAGNATLTVSGSLVNAGGSVDFGSASTGTVRRRPLWAPVVVSITSWTPAIHDESVVRRRLSR